MRAGHRKVARTCRFCGHCYLYPSSTCVCTHVAHKSTVSVGVFVRILHLSISIYYRSQYLRTLKYVIQCDSLPNLNHTSIRTPGVKTRASLTGRICRRGCFPISLLIWSREPVDAPKCKACDTNPYKKYASLSVA